MPQPAGDSAARRSGLLPEGKLLLQFCEFLHELPSSEESLTVTNPIPDIVIGRLPIYLRELTRMADEGDKLTTSSHELAERLGISSAQIRKDLSHFGEFGKQGTGYHIQYLIERLNEILKLQHEWPVALVGVGFLGHAIASYRGFESRGFRIAWLFDSDSKVIGEKIGDLVVHDVAELETTIHGYGAKVALLAVPAAEAQAITDRLVRAGIKAILSYAPISLSAPPGVHISYSDPVVQLQQMTYFLEPEQE